MEKRSELYVKGDQKGIDELEKELLAQNAQHKDWTCSEEMMKLTKDGKALYLHCLPADISGLSCTEGEVDNSVFDRYLVPLYKQASYKPYIIAAMIFLAQVKDPVKALMDLDCRRQQAQDVLSVFIESGAFNEFGIAARRAHNFCGKPQKFHTCGLSGIFPVGRAAG